MGEARDGRGSLMNQVCEVSSVITKKISIAKNCCQS